MEETKVEPATAAGTVERRTAAAGGGGRRPRLGHLAVWLLVFEALTGLGLMFHYRPTVDAAYLDLVDLREVSTLGVLRQLHLWGAHAAVIVVWLHLLQTGFRGAWAAPRRVNWSVGVALLLLTLLLAATGYLLPWDQEAYWGIATLSPSGAADAPGLEGSDLLTAYVLHSVVLPLMVAGLTFYHLSRARRDAGRAAPGRAAPSDGETVPSSS